MILFLIDFDSGKRGNHGEASFPSFLVFSGCANAKDNISVMEKNKKIKKLKIYF